MCFQDHILEEAKEMLGPEDENDDIPGGVKYRPTANKANGSRVDDVSVGVLSVESQVMYGVEDVPPLYLCILLGFQVILLNYEGNND